MERADILENQFSINRVLRVIKAENKNCHKKSFVDGRPSDVFVYILSGSCDYVCEDGTSFTVKAGDIMYLSQGERYTLYINEEYRFIFCDFEFSDQTPKKSAFFTPKHDSSAEKLFMKLLNLYNAQGKTYFTESLSLIYAIYSAVTATKNDVYITKTNKDKMVDVKEYVDCHYADVSLSIPHLAKLVDMSEVYLRKLFKAEIGVSPTEYITSVRLKKAKQLMKYYPFLTLGECAKQSGFSSPHYFSRVFRNEFGINPSKYRKSK
jgi:AraC-like DNA-binding protein